MPLSSNYSKKIVIRDALAAMIQDFKRQGKTIVTTNGSFDILHIGHVTMLQEAKSLGDVLIVGVNSDDSVRRYKGKYRPICRQKHRVGMLAALECTDYITVFDELTPISLLEIIRPHIHVNSPEHGYDCVERDVVERYGGRIHLARLIEGMSTSQLIERIQEAASHQRCQGIFLHVADVLDIMEDQAQILTDKILKDLQQLHTAGWQIFFLADHVDENVAMQQQCAQRGLRFRKIYHAGTATALTKAVEDYDVSLAKSVLISRDLQDIRVGRELNCKTVLLKNLPDSDDSSRSACSPHYAVNTLREAVVVLTANKF